MTLPVNPSSAGPAGPRITVAVPTYRRPAQLQALLTAVVAQLDEPEGGAAGVVVIDNDAARTAAPVVDGLADDRVRYAAEQRPGVAAVRNRALLEAADSDVLIFIDDDQVPAAGWLLSLIRTWQCSGAGAVAGPVVSELPPDVDPWIRDGGFFDRAYRNALRTGDRIDEVATTNLLLDMAHVRAHELRFDERFGLSGGEDSLFTRSLVRAGRPIVWCAEARVIEPVPAQRLNRSWVCRRAISSGNGAVRVRLTLERSRQRRIQVRIRYAGAGAVRVAGGAVASLRAAAGRGADGRSGRSARTAFRGLGMLAGALGFTYLEYARDGRHWSVGTAQRSLS